MTPTSDERREVAEKLRENAGKHGVVLDYLGSKQVASWWLLLHTIDCDSNEQEVAFRMLADLIDPECAIVSTDCSCTCRTYRLSCGHSVSRPLRSNPPKYCSVCGARVVS